MASGFADRREKHRRNGEMLEHRDDVGKRLVKCQHVETGRLLVAGMQPVEQRVGGFVRHDVVRQAVEHQATRQIVDAVRGARK